MRHLPFFIGLIFFLIACSSNTTPNNIEDKDLEKNLNLETSFKIFYEKFHTDSAYQIEHIVFPLQGYPSMMDSTIEDFRWQKTDWRMHKIISDSIFVKEYHSIGNLVTEFISDKTSGYSMERRFMQNEGTDWSLIYYQGMNR